MIGWHRSCRPQALACADGVRARRRTDMGVAAFLRVSVYFLSLDLGCLCTRQRAIKRKCVIVQY